MRRRVIRATNARGETVEIVRMEPETEEDVEELRRLARAGLLDTDENAGDAAATNQARDS